MAIQSCMIESDSSKREVNWKIGLNGVFMNKMMHQASQSGFTLLEAIAALAVMGAAVAGVYSLTDQSLKDRRASMTAMHMKTVGDAATEYIRKNYGVVTGAATAANPALIRIADLIADGDLPAGYSITNPENQSTCVLVLEPTSNNLTALVVTEGGNQLADLNLAQIASTIGGAGGGIYGFPAPPVPPPITIRGSMGGWEFAPGNFGNANNLGQRCNGTAGAVTFTPGHPMMALWFEDGAVAATLYRDAVPGNPALNTMNTPIIMGAAATRTEGSGCGTDPNGSIARAPDGTVISCVSGIWTRSGSNFWRDPVANFASLPATDPPGAVRVTTDTGRAFTRRSGTWQALAVDQNGNMMVPNSLTVLGSSFVGGGLSVNGNSTVLGNSSVGTNLLVGGKATIHVLDGNLKVDRTATDNTGCVGEGMIGRSTVNSGVILSCQSGIWRPMQGSGAPQHVGWGGGYVPFGYTGQYVPCPPGKFVTGFTLNVPGTSYPWLGGYGAHVIPWRQGCSAAGVDGAYCANVYTPGQWDNWNWGNTYDFGGTLICR